MKNLFLLILLTMGMNSHAQGILTTYKNPDQINICDTGIFKISLKYIGADSSKTTKISLKLPEGVSYLEGSATNVTGVTFFSSQKIDFDVASIKKDTTLMIGFRAYVECVILNSINTGKLFFNEMTVNNNNYVQQIKTLPYEIVSPLPIFTKVSDPFLKGAKDDVLLRVLTIKNTRLGSLRAFRFEDNHDGGMLLSSSDGKPVLSNPTQLHLDFSADDFKKIGDKDGLFEEGETLNITEKILVTECGTQLFKSKSKLNIIWGCANASVCKTEQITAVVSFLKKKNEPKIVLDYHDSPPADYCAETPSKQSLKISNVGKDTAFNVRVELNSFDELIHFNQLSFSLFDGFSFKKITPKSFISSTLDCNSGLITDIQDVFVFPTLAPNVTYKLSWNYFSCKPDCNEKLDEEEDEEDDEDVSKVSWAANVAYSKACSTDEEFTFVEVIQGKYKPKIEQVLTLGSEFKDGTIASLDFFLDLEKMKDSSGVIDVKFKLPCGFSWLDGAMTVGGIPAQNFSKTTDAGGNELITMSFPFPFLDDTPGKYRVQFNCGTCIPIGPNYNVAVSSCGSTISNEFAGSDTIRVGANFRLKGVEGCGIPKCYDYQVIYNCTKDVFVYDSVPGYARVRNQFKRITFGQADNDDDRIADAGGQLDLSQIRRDHFVAGDTATLYMKSNITTEKPNVGVDNARVQVYFEFHKADVDKIKYGGGSRVAMNFVPLDLQLKIYSKKLNETFSCPLPQGIFLKATKIVAGGINTLPVSIVDSVACDIYQYVLNPQSVACLPSDYKFLDGDSIVINGKYWLNFNLRDKKLRQPRANVYRVRSATSLFNDNNGCDEIFCEQDSKRIAVSGYGIYQKSPLYHILDCKPKANDTYSFLFGTIPAYPNFFPYEYRKIGKVSSVEIGIGSPLILESAYAKPWRVLGGNTVFANQKVNFFQKNKQNFTFDLLPFQMPMQDEGFEVVFDNTFASVCQDSSGNLFNTDYSIFPENPANKPELINYKVPNAKQKKAFVFDYNKLDVSSIYDEYVSFDNTGLWLLDYSNSSNFDAPNPYLYFTNVTSVDDVKVFIDSVEVKTFNGIYLLPDVKANKGYTVKVTGVNKSCDIGKITANVGWHCSPLQDTSKITCLGKKINLIVTPTPGEVELDVNSDRDSIEMCKPSEYVYLDVKSVRFGAVFNPELTLQLPTGLSVLVGSCQIAYPADTAKYIDIADPTILSNGQLGWNLIDLVAKIKQNGLAGLANEPLNRLKIRFKFITQCGFISGESYSANIVAYEICGKKTNEVKRAGKSILLQGVVPLYQTTIAVDTLTAIAQGCNSPINLYFNVILDGETGKYDSIYLYLPLNVAFLSYLSLGAGNLIAPPDVFVENGKTVVRWKMPEGLKKGEVISLRVTTKGWGANGCKTEFYSLKTSQRQVSFCASQNVECNLGFISGVTKNFKINIQHPDFNIKDITAKADSNSVYFTAQVKNNIGADTTTFVAVRLVADVNGNGKIDGNDYTISSVALNYFFPSNGEWKDIKGNIGKVNIPDSLVCKLLLVLDSKDNCACQTVFLPIKVLDYKKKDYIVCSGDKKVIGALPQMNNLYTWNDSKNLTCNNCPNPTFSYTTTISSETIFNYNLKEKSINCDVFYEIVVKVPALPKIQATSTTFSCKGEPLILSTNVGKTFQWAGSGIVNPNQATQIITAQKDSWYRVTVTDANQCKGTDSIFLKLTPLGSKGKRFICPKKNLVLNGKAYSNPGTYEVKYTLGTNCDSTFTMELILRDSVAIDLPTTIDVKDNTSFEINAPKGNYTYFWSPSDFLSCNNCVNPTITNPDKDLTYILQMVDENGCASTRRIRLNSLFTCGIDRVKPVSVFLPDGDVVDNQDFRFYGLPNFNIPIAEIKIFNRWGELIYTETSGNPKWNGIANRKPSPTDTYIVVYKVACEGSDDKWQKITVTLLR